VLSVFAMFFATRQLAALEIVWRNTSIFTKLIPVHVAPKVLSFRLENDGMSMSVFGTYFNQYCICSFDGMSSFAIFVNNTAIRCILPRTNSEIFKFSTVCDGLSSEPLSLYQV